MPAFPCHHADLGHHLPGNHELLLERSAQAQFMIPMAISLAVGIVFATVITLLLVPSLYMILDDLGRLFRREDSAVEADLGRA